MNPKLSPLLGALQRACSQANINILGLFLTETGQFRIDEEVKHKT